MKLKQKQIFGLVFALIIATSTVLAAFASQSVFAYKCHDGHYYDEQQQVCKTYKDEGTRNKGDGSKECPSGGAVQDGHCWVKGGEKQNYAPIQDDGKEIPTSSIGCKGYHVLGESGDRETYYYADRYSCCTHGYDIGIGSDTINRSRCVDPTIPQKDPSSKNDNGQGNGSQPGSSNPSQPADVNGGTGISGSKGQCGNARTNLISCKGKGVNAIGDVLKLVLTIMSVGIGILAVGGIIYAAILYASAQDNAGQTKKAIEMITNIVIGLLLYIFMVAIINWLVPGGVIG